MRPSQGEYTCIHYQLAVARGHRWTRHHGSPNGGLPAFAGGGGKKGVDALMNHLEVRKISICKNHSLAFRGSSPAPPSRSLELPWDCVAGAGSVTSNRSRPLADLRPGRPGKGFPQTLLTSSTAQNCGSKANAYYATRRCAKARWRARDHLSRRGGSFHPASDINTVD